MSTWAEDGIQIVTYRRSDDGKVWTYRCRLEGNRGIWAAEQGRWRNGPVDGIITFELSQDQRSVSLTEVHEDGSKSQGTYPRGQTEIGRTPNGLSTGPACTWCL